MGRSWIVGVSLALVACGGGNNGGGTIGAPSPAPPNPTGGTSSAVFAVTAFGPMLAQILFDNNASSTFRDTSDAVSSTDIDGRFGQGISVLEPKVQSGKIPTTANVRMEATGVDGTTGLFFSQMRAPAGSTVISPLTALIDAAGSESAVRSALGLDQGPDALRGPISLIAFNPALNLSSSDPDSRHNAAQLTRLNLRLLAMAAVLTDTNGDPVDSYVTLLDGSRYMAEQIAATGRLDLTDSATIRSLFGRSRYQYGGTPEQRDAMALFIAKYNAALPNDLGNADVVRGWALSFRFALLPDFKVLTAVWPNTAASRIDAIGAAQMAQLAAEFAADPAPSRGTFMAVPDYAEIRVPEDSTIFTGCNGSVSISMPMPSCNDRNPFTLEVPGARVVSVTSSQPLFLAADLEPNFLRLRRLGTTFRGLVRVTYTSELPNGARSNGVLYANVVTPGK